VCVRESVCVCVRERERERERKRERERERERERLGKLAQQHPEAKTRVWIWSALRTGSAKSGACFVHDQPEWRLLCACSTEIY